MPKEQRKLGWRSPLMRAGTLVALFAGGTILSFLAVSTTLKQTPSTRAAPAPPPSKEAVATAMAGIAEQVAANQVKPRFTGKVGDFEVVATQQEADMAQPCQAVPSKTLDASNLSASELNIPGTWEDNVCADGTVVSSHSALGGRSYFVGAPRIAADAPADLFEVTTIPGHPALIVRPPADPGPYFGYAILREPAGTKPGILLGVIGHGSRQAAVASLQMALSQ